MPVQGPSGRPNQRVRPNGPEKQTVKRRVSRSRSLPNQPLRLAGHVYKSRIRILRLALLSFPRNYLRRRRRYWTDDARSAGNTVGIRSGCQCRVRSDDAHPGTGKIPPPASRTLNMPRLTLPKKRPVKHTTSSPTLYASTRLRARLSTVASSVFVS